jgi:hypothetical protein
MAWAAVSRDQEPTHHHAMNRQMPIIAMPRFAAI